MSEREYRKDNSRKRDSDEGDIARYERYRYGGGTPATPQYNNIGSTRSIEQLINDPLDVLYDPEEEYFVVNNMNEWEYRDDLDWEEDNQNAELPELLKKKNSSSTEDSTPRTYSRSQGYVPYRVERERRRKLRENYDRALSNESIQTENQSPIVVINGSDIAIAGTPTTYALKNQKRGNKLTYQWTVINDPVAVAREKANDNPNPISESVTFPMSKNSSFKVPWAFQGNHKLVVEVFRKGIPINTYSYEQQVQAANTNQLKSSTKEEKSSLLNVAELDSVGKLTEAVKRSASALPGELATELQALLSPATLATMASVFAIYVAAHSVGVGQAMDIGMLIAGGVFFGMDAFTIFKDIAGFANAVNAQNENELDKAGQHLASAVAKIGVDAVMTLLTSKVAKKIAGIDETDATRDLIEPGGKNNPNPDNGSMRSIENVNPGYPKQGRTLNCVNCTVATDATLDGRPAQALESTETSIRVLERQYGSRFIRVRSEEQIIQMFQKAGNGKRGIVLVGQKIEGSRRIAYHVFNVANQEGTIRFLDGQTSKVGASINDLVASVVSISVLKTN